MWFQQRPDTARPVTAAPPLRKKFTIPIASPSSNNILTTQDRPTTTVYDRVRIPSESVAAASAEGEEHGAADAPLHNNIFLSKKVGSLPHPHPPPPSLLPMELEETSWDCSLSFTAASSVHLYNSDSSLWTGSSEWRILQSQTAECFADKAQACPSSSGGRSTLLHRRQSDKHQRETAERLLFSFTSSSNGPTFDPTMELEGAASVVPDPLAVWLRHQRHGEEYG